MILVVEDDPVYAQFIASTLRDAGHNVEIAATAAAARANARALRPDAVLLDLKLPDESGYDLARTFRSDVLDSESIIILLTADMHPQRDVAEAVGIDMVLTKPVEPVLVVGMVDLIRARRRKRLAPR
jgi:DNA-binding response OmpR family regulator